MKIITFDIGGTFIKYALCDENFNLTESTKIPTDAASGGRKLIEKVIEIINLIKDNNVSLIKLYQESKKLNKKFVYRKS